ncbi:MAG TPA: threonine/serine exporter family protein [Actinomycetes bacterium]|nr:threonine/serine exporter family protein [Actinomycetes bacterium]
MTESTPSRWRTALWRGETAPIPAVRVPTRAVYPRRRPGDESEVAAVDQGASLALRVGTLLLAGGAPTEDVEAAIFAVGTAVGLGVFEVDITYKSIIISVAPDGDRPGLTDMRVVRGRSTHFARVAAAHRLVLDLAEGRISPNDVEPRLSEIERLRRPYPRWFVVASFGALSAAITVQLGGSAWTAAVALAAAAFTGVLGIRMARMHVPTFFVNMVLALGATLVAVLVTANQDSLQDLEIKTPLVIVGGIIALLPGMTLMVAAQEAIGSFAVTAAARFVELTFATVGIVSGVLIGLVVADEFSVTMPTVVSPDYNALGVTTAVIAAAIAATFAAVTYQSLFRLAWTGGVLAGVGYFIFLWAKDQVTNLGVATAIPAVAIGALAALFAGRLKVPPVLLTAAGIIPLLPGLAVYQGLLFLSRSGRTSGDAPTPTDLDKGLGSLVEATTIAVALAAGVLLGQLMVSRLLRTPLRGFIPQRSQRSDHYR